MVEGDVVDCIIALPGQLFYSTQIPACLWFLARNKGNHRFRDRRGEVLFIDARKLGHLVDRTRREFSDDDIARIVTIYHAWRGEKGAGEYQDIPGYCKVATLDEIRTHNHVLTPIRYVGVADLEDDGAPFEERFATLKTKLEEHFAEGRTIEERISSILKGVRV
jgi:type I restriction enzyme M protein